uniref:Endoplasmic reticulum-Golgi intermediate compartment protein n=1 Tax=Pseudonaja textilis TaxID=8673 RepID=A0A670YZB8_PSETE
MRRLNRKKTLNLVKELDAFPKVPESYIETSASGGTDIGADVLDLAETMVATADGLVYEPVIFELSPMQREWQRILQNIQARLQEEHSLQDIIFKSAFKSASTALPPREDNPVHSADACRIHGHLYVNKVAGNFHVTVGKYPQGSVFPLCLLAYNFSHRIDHLSFGELIPGIINPLDGTEKIASDHNQMFQYFVTVVPTKLQTHKISAETHQFAVTERERVINHAAGSHGVSGIFMKYDISSLMVTVTEEHMPFWQFIIRLCGIVGGIFSTTGILHSIGGFIVEIICCRFRLKSSKSTPVRLCFPLLPHTENRIRL